MRTSSNPSTQSRQPAGLAWPLMVPLTIAALAMVATLPGRTHGLGLITELLLTDLQIDRVTYANINLWATLLGASFCIPCGWLIDRLGSRSTLSATCVLLGLVVTGMTLLSSGSVVLLFCFVVLTRGLGQSALSVISLTIMGKTVGKKSRFGVAVYSVLCTVGFIAAFVGIKYWESTRGNDLDPSEHWRTLWSAIGFCVVGFGAISWIPRHVPAGNPTEGENSSGQSRSGNELSLQETKPEELTFRQALATQAFWAFALATSFYGMVAAGISLFNQSILEDRGFDRSLFLTITAIGPLLGLVANLGTGAAAIKVSLEKLLALAMLLLAGALLGFPFVQTLVHIYAYAITLAVAGGMITVLFFAVWSKHFGETHLGKIQGAAQMLTVFASAIGPLLLALCKDWTDSYDLFYRSAGGVSLGLAGWAYFVHLPEPAIVLPGESLRGVADRVPLLDVHPENAHEDDAIRTDETPIQ